MTTSAVLLSAEEFYHEFLPRPRDYPGRSTAERNPFDALQNANKMNEKELSELIEAAVNGNGLVAGSTASRYHLPPDCEYENGTQLSTALFRTGALPTAEHPHWANQSVPIHVQTHRTGIDPFDAAAPQDDYGALKRSRTRVLDRISDIAEILFAAQQRVSFFILFFVGRRFRVLRWDRAGVVGTHAIDYYDYPHILCDFLWRIGQLDESGLGFDPSATRILPGDIDFTRMDFASLETDTDMNDTERPLHESEVREHPVFEYVRSLFRTSLSDGWPRYKLQVSDGKRSRAYLVGKPTFRSPEVLGRGTRGYVAYECDTGRFVWLKDVWRASYILTKTEGEVLRKLNAAGVSRVPTLVCDGDVHDQATITADWWERIQARAIPPHRSTSVPSSSLGSKKRKRPRTKPAKARAKSLPDGILRQHRHYRVVVEEVCMPLKKSQYGRQLVGVIHDCAATHPETRLLHCDVSGGNILIYPKILRVLGGQIPTVVWTGVLTDWELSISSDSCEMASKTTLANRMGTYQFMSVNLLTRITSPVEISDELESFFHVLVYYAVRYLRSNCPDISFWIEDYFHRYAGPERMLTCGQKSYTVEVAGWLRIRSPLSALVFRSPMDDVLSDILHSLWAHYKIMEYDAAQAFPPPPRPNTPPQPLSLLDELIYIAKYGKYAIGSDPEQVEKWEAQSQVCLVDEGPTPKERKLAKQVADHKFMLDRLARALRDPRWRCNDRIPTSHDWKPSSTDANANGDASARSPKRQRMSGCERNVSLPARLHPSTSRARPGARTHPLRARR
ncbi:hypothetical protein BD309DRAFT_927514 [Dichomitus squalens]|uniref:Fungal-type protein kinase domain-containing protein n=1 Tax=Dichomitus squalens TaxID=114155 RepID=A0A4Q9NGH8_9APHY|nr:hypothetical protein BD309DRAFT_927514 [Dichomitus squalens]TBU56971.1 hypothetical protein BD310DRAFT_881659 [Dichomitus squalens]